jgi:hypothetical protein
MEDQIKEIVTTTEVQIPTIMKTILPSFLRIIVIQVLQKLRSQMLVIRDW